MPNLATIPPPAKQATSAYEIKSLYKPTSSSSLAARPSFTSALSFPTPPPSSSDSEAHSPPSSPETDAHPSRQGSDSSSTEEEDEENDSVPAPLPSFTMKPRGIREREQSRTAGKKPVSLAAAMAKKRAEEARWAKYANMGTFEVTLDLRPEELQRI